MHRCVVVLALALLIPVGASDAIAGQPTGAGSVRITVPADVDGETSIALELSLPAEVAAVDGRLLVDPGAAQLVGIAPVGRGAAFAPQEMAGGFAFGAYDLKAAGGRTSLRLVLAPLTTGQLELRLVIDAAANATGDRIALTEAPLLAVMRVGNGNRRFSAPAVASRPQPVRAPGALRDLIPDGTVGPLDLDVARAGWEQAHANELACGSYVDLAADANGDGCVDIVDIQALVAAQGRRVAVATPPTNVPDAALAQAGLTFVVTSTADTPDANNGDGLCADAQGRCTLRAALTESNWQRGDNRIAFNLPGTAPVPIQLGGTTSSLLIQDRSGSLVIDGYTQPGSRVNSAKVGSNAILGVELRGTGNSPLGNGLRITSANNLVRGILFNNFNRGIFIDGPDAHDNRIVGDLFGYTSTGAVHSYFGHEGVTLNNGANHNIVGTPALADRNVARAVKALYLYGPGTDFNVLQNNLLCMTPSGSGIASCWTGVDHDFGPKSNLLGGSGPNERNVIGRTANNGIEISHGYDPRGIDTSTRWQNNNNRVIGNWIGFRGDGSYDATFRSGQTDPGTGDNGNGVNVYDGSNFNLVEGNWVASVYDGIQTMSPNSTGNTIRANIVGESPLGQAAPLTRDGIVVRLNTRSDLVEGNVVRNAGRYGIGLTQKDVLWVRVSRNVVSDMAGQAIYFAPDPANPTRGADNLLAPPVIASATTIRVDGSGRAGATVEVYRASRVAGQSGLPVAYLGSTIVGGNGAWSLPVSLAATDRTTALQIDPNGNTSALGLNMAVGSGTSLAVSDSFGRTVSNGWGRADIGGLYLLQGMPANFSVGNGLGQIVLPAAATRSAILDGVAQRDVDIRLRVAADRVVAGGNAFIYCVARGIGNNEYRPRLILNAGGTVSVNASVLVNGAESPLGAPVALAGLSQHAGQFIWLHASVTGANLTTIRVKAWADGQPEPGSWAFTATDSATALQAAGTVGLRAWLSGSVVNAPLALSFDDYSIAPSP